MHHKCNQNEAPVAFIFPAESMRIHQLLSDAWCLALLFACLYFHLYILYTIYYLNVFFLGLIYPQNCIFVGVLENTKICVALLLKDC